MVILLFVFWQVVQVVLNKKVREIIHMNIKNLLTMSFFGLALSACGGSFGGGGNSDSDSDNAVGNVVIDGVASEGETLTATVSDDNGVLTEDIAYAWSADGVIISGARSSSFIPSDEQVGSVLTVTAVYVDEAGFLETVISSATDVIVAVNDAGTVVIAGNPVVGEELTAAVSDDDGVPETITYQWSANNVEIAGATNVTFTPMPEQVGLTLTVSAVYVDDQGFSEDIESSATGMVTTTEVNSEGTIAVTGITTVGETLTAAVMDTNGIATSIITYAWFANGIVISDATLSTYLITSAEVGAAITASANYIDDDGFMEAITSTSTSIVDAINTVGSIGAITGNPIEGDVLTAGMVTDMNGLANATFMYQWAAGGTNIAGATSATYTLTSAEVGEEVTVTVTYTDDDNHIEMLTSAATDTIVAATENTVGSVSISGVAGVGQTLTAEVTDINGTDNATITYVWQADNVTIDGATAATYVLTTEELDAEITVRVTYTDDGGFDEDSTSSPTAAVVAANSVGTIGAITGTLVAGELLTAGAITDSDGTSNAVFAYQWAAGDTNIAGATGSTYTLTSAEVGDMITVTVTYTDDNGSNESVTSAATGVVVAPNIGGAVEITSSGTLLVGDELTAEVTDDNDVTGAIVYQWKADDMDIAGATAQTYILLTTQAGSVITVNAQYTDDGGFAEDITSEAAEGEDPTNRVYSFVVDGEAGLMSAAAAAADGDWIALDTAAGADGNTDYVDMAEINFDTDNLVITTISDATAQITGATCIEVGGDNTIVDGLSFDALDIIGLSTCDGNGNSSVYISGDNVTLRNSEFLGEVDDPSVAIGAPYHWISVKGFQNIIERNLFTGKDTDLEGSVITLFNNSTADAQEDHTIQYNLFKDIIGKSGVPASRDSGAHAIQVGRSTASSSAEDGLNTIQYNRFENVLTERRIMRVQSSNNTITHNTFIDSAGLLALEDGYGNEASFNIFLPTGDDSDDGGISFTPLGHTVIDNYIANVRTTSSQRAALLINHDPLSGGGNAAIIANDDIDKTTIVARNTVVNARQAIRFETNDCDDINALLDFDGNLIANEGTNNNGNNRDAVTETAYITAGCRIDTDSDFDDNHFYSQDLTDDASADAFDFNGATGADGNIAGAEGGAEIVADGDGLFNGDGADAGIGADTANLTVILEENVGPNTTWEAPLIGIDN